MLLCGAVGCDEPMAEPTPSSEAAPRAPVRQLKWAKIPAGQFMMGAVPGDPYARADELPAHEVAVDGFWMTTTEITNAQFEEFVEATGYLTTAERPIDWEVIKQQLPPGTPEPPAEDLVPGATVFTPPQGESGFWWKFVRGANWRHPGGPETSIEGRDNEPVVQVSYDDAVAYAEWAGGRLPTEAEWEWASRGGLEGQVYAWGEEDVDTGTPKANTWQGQFPNDDTGRDGFTGVAPVARFPPNGYGLYDMAGNVWEWTRDWYRHDAYQQVVTTTQGVAQNPTGPSDSFDPEEPGIAKRVVRGGSFLCHHSYCASYRSSARMKTSPDTGLNHQGFRIVRDTAPGEGRVPRRPSGGRVEPSRDTRRP